MSPDGEFLRNQPWRNAYGAWIHEPYGHFHSPHDAFYAASFAPPPAQFPVAYPNGSGLDGGPPAPPQSCFIPDGTSGLQLGPHAYHQPSPYSMMMEGPAPLWAIYPDPAISSHQWHVQSGMMAPWGWPHRPDFEPGRLGGGHNPALGWNPMYMWNAQPAQQQQEQKQEQQQHQHQQQHQQEQPPRRHRRRRDASPRRPTAHNHQRKRHSLLRSPTPESTAGCPNRSSTPKPTQCQIESRSPLREILRSAGKLSRTLLSTPRRTASRLSRSASRARHRKGEEDGSGGDEEEEEDEQGDDSACWSDGGVESPTPRNLAGDDRGATAARGSASRGWGSLRRRSEHGVRRGEGRPPKARGKQADEPGVWQQEYQRMSARRAGGEEGRRPRPQSYPALTNHRHTTARSPGDGHENHHGRMARREGGGGGGGSDRWSDGLEGDRSIARMNGLLDIWDAQGNPGWEEEAFALCDLSRCRRCGRFYAPMRTVRHRCRS